jgi:hypothetical protein
MKLEKPDRDVFKENHKEIFFFKKTMLNNEIRKENKPKRECRPTLTL